jgi:hypothetical protein
MFWKPPTTAIDRTNPISWIDIIEGVTNCTKWA